MTNNKQQTAVEWLVEQFKEYDFADVKDTENYIIKMQSFVLTEKLEQAKEMEIAGKEMNYDDGYAEGYKRALELVEWAIGEMKIKNNTTNKPTEELSND
jgi:hypothetical protein